MELEGVTITSQEVLWKIEEYSCIKDIRANDAWNLTPANLIVNDDFVFENGEYQ